jgi:hypothetical protein
MFLEYLCIFLPDVLTSFVHLLKYQALFFHEIEKFGQSAQDVSAVSGILGEFSFQGFL